MKLKEILYGLGFKPKPVEYGYDVRKFQLPQDGEVSLAVWRHPGTLRRPFDITQTAIDALREFLRPGDVAIDIGGHYGDTAVPMAAAVGPAGKVFALEPNPYVFKVLAVNAGLNPGRGRIIPLPFAAMPEDGEYEFRYQDPGFNNGGLIAGISPWVHGNFYTMKVQGRNVLKYLREHHPADVDRIRYLKIDTEGDDHAIARSLEPLINEKRPYITTEMYTYRSENERVAYFRWLRDHGYRLYKTTAQSYRGIPLTEGDLMKWKHLDVFGEPE